MDFNVLLSLRQIPLEEVVLLRHTPREPDLESVLPALRVSQPDLFNAYQQTQSKKVEESLLKAKYAASFIGRESLEAVFAGLYRIDGHRPLTREQFWRHSSLLALRDRYGMKGFRDEDKRQTIVWFDLTLTDFYEEWSGRLVVQWPQPLPWHRRAHTTPLPVVALLEENAFDPPLLAWAELRLSWDRLNSLGPSWRAKLREWRGIYYICDEDSKFGYVGSAYGEDNILGRWLNYAASGHGDNKHLKGRNPASFRFSILERVSPDLPRDEVIAKETSWKLRLNTRWPHGLNAN